MSWLDRVNNDIVIQTGDGKKFSPQWIKTAKTFEFNTTEFNFPNVPGSFLDRREHKGTRFTMEVYFQGDDNLDLSDAFVESAKDKRFWILTHPMYGKMTVQPLSMAIDDKFNNATKFSIPIIETITDLNPKTEVIVEDKIAEDAADLSEIGAINFEASADIKAQDVNAMEANADSFFINAVNKILDNADGEGFFNIYNAALGLISNAIEDPLAAMKKTQELIQAPGKFNQGIQSRIIILQANFDSLEEFVSENLLDVSLQDKLIYEYSQHSVLLGLCIASSTPFDDNDYENRNQVSDVIETILANNNKYFETLDRIQVGDGNNPGDFLPNPSTMLGLNDLVNFTTGNLYKVGLDAKQERFLTLENDTDIINLAHRLYGPKKDDSHIDELMRNNKFGLNGILVLKKDKVVTYYI